MRKSIIILLAILCMPFVASAQKLTGKVVDATTQQALIGASLFWKNTTAGATTSATGEFTIKRVHGFDTLVVNYLGYDTRLDLKVAVKEFFMKEYCNRDADTSFVSVPSAGGKEIKQHGTSK